MAHKIRPNEGTPRRRISVRVTEDDVMDAKRIAEADTTPFINVSHFYETAIRYLIDRYRHVAPKDADDDRAA